jgi:phosphohistidine phosphatase
MILYFLRHASAGEPLSNPKKDETRALDKDGVNQCGYIGRALTALETQVDSILTSPLKRCTQTASLVANELGHEGKLHLEAALRPEATFSDFRRMLEKYARQDAVMVVGHNPNLSQFLGILVGGAEADTAFDLKKGAIARVDLKRGGGTLQWCLTPRVLRTLHDTAVESSRPKTSRK